MSSGQNAVVILHANCIAGFGRGLLITGASGSGKSGLSLQLMAMGALLVADDRTEVFLRDGQLIGRAGPNLFGLIEARGVGLLRVPAAMNEVALVGVVDLDTTQVTRMPEPQKQMISGVALDLIYKVQGEHFPAALLCYLQTGSIGI